MAQGKMPYRGFREARITFDPTCKLKQCTGGGAVCPPCRQSADPKKMDCYVTKRAPSHCDRVLWAIMPCGAGAPAATTVVTNTAYTTFNDTRSAIIAESDHDPVMAKFRVAFQ